MVVVVVLVLLGVMMTMIKFLFVALRLLREPRLPDASRRTMPRSKESLAAITQVGTSLKAHINPFTSKSLVPLCQTERAVLCVDAVARLLCVRLV